MASQLTPLANPRLLSFVIVFASNLSVKVDE